MMMAMMTTTTTTVTVARLGDTDGFEKEDQDMVQDVQAHVPNGGLQFSPLLDNRSSRSGQTASDVERTSTMSLNAFCHFDICTLDDGDWRYVFGVIVMFRGIL